MTATRLLCAFVTILTPVLCRAAPAASPPPYVPGPDPKFIDHAIGKAKAYLYSVQANGHWDLPKPGPAARPDERGNMSLTDIQNSSQWGGLSALVVYTLLSSGENAQDPRLAPAIEFLKTAEIEGTYALGCRLLVWNAMPASRHKEMLELAKRDRDLLLKNLRTDETGNAGLFRYTADPYEGADHSASQFAVLGLWAAEQVGAEVPAKAWRMMETRWLKDQDASGGWNYGKHFSNAMPVTPSMTAAGVASLFILNDQLHIAAAADCRGNPPHKAIDAGIAWINAHADEYFQAKNPFPFYTLYGIERIGLASGYKYLGTVDWYKQGAGVLLDTQNDDGSWGAGPADTCFAVLFLTRGRAPLVMSKLQYEIDTHGDTPRPANWNQRPRDAANLSRWISRQLEREVNWQIVNLKGAVEDLHDAPILYIAGNQQLSFSNSDEEKLRQFVYQGGLILANADCSNPAFATSFKKLGTKLFPPYEFRELPAGHLVFENLYSHARWKNPPRVQALSNGARELMVLLPLGDPARFWQTGAVAGHEPAYELLANLFLYCSERRDLRYKGESWLVTPDPKLPATRTLKIARIRHDYNWDPEPGGWTRLAAILHNQDRVDLTIVTVKLGDGALRQGGYALAHLTTTGRIKLKEPDRADLKAFLDGGGTLLADATGGDPEAAAALESELTALAGAKFAPLAADSPIFANLGVPADQIGYRPYAVKRSVGQLKGPRLKAISVKGRPAILFSPDDLSVGLVGEPIDGILGYTPASATAIVRSIVLGIP